MKRYYITQPQFEALAKEVGAVPVKSAAQGFSVLRLIEDIGEQELPEEKLAEDTSIHSESQPTVQ